MEINHLTATEQEIAGWCNVMKGQPGTVIGGHVGANLILKMNAAAVVKFGVGLNEVAATNQCFAHGILPGQVFRVPRVYRYFQSHSQCCLDPRHRIGYLVMEYVAGVPLSLLGESDLVRAMVKAAIRSMAQLSAQKPGPPWGAPPDGAIWANRGPRGGFETVAEMENWFNRTLSWKSTSMQLASYDLQFCHLDLSPSNILFLPDSGSICILDWGSAGFYPWIFAVWSNTLPTANRHYFNALLEGIRPTDQDRLVFNQLSIAYHLNKRYRW